MTPYRYYRYLRKYLGYRPAQARVSVLMAFCKDKEDYLERMRRNWNYWKDK